MGDLYEAESILYTDQLMLTQVKSIYKRQRLIFDSAKWIWEMPHQSTIALLLPLCTSEIVLETDSMYL